MRTVSCAFAVVLALGLAGRGGAETKATPAPDSYASILRRIAQSIEGVKGDYPQLSEFSASVHCNVEQLAITYEYLTETPRRTGGWTSGVPSPTDQGVWLYIDFHAPDSKQQLHTQPVVPRYRFRDKGVMFLLREGAQTKSLEGKLVRILLDHGVRPVERP